MHSSGPARSAVSASLRVGAALLAEGAALCLEAPVPIALLSVVSPSVNDEPQRTWNCDGTIREVLSQVGWVHKRLANLRHVSLKRLCSHFSLSAAYKARLENLQLHT